MTTPVKDNPLGRLFPEFPAGTPPLNAKVVRQEVERILNQHGLGSATAYLPSHGELAQLFNEFNRAMRMPSSENPSVIDADPAVNADFIPHYPQEECQQSQSARPATKWVPLPETSEARHLVTALATQDSPASCAQHDGLHAFLNSESAAIASHQLNSGAALLLPRSVVQAWLNTNAVKLPTPELARMVTLLQVILPAIAFQGDTTSLGTLVHRLMRNLPQAEMAKVMTALIETFEQSPLAALPEAQQILLGCIAESGLMEGSLAESLGKQLSAMRAAGSPMIAGVREMFGGQVWQGLQHILQPLLRALTGIFLMRPEAQFPKCIADERFAAQLATCFGAQSQKRDKRKSRRRKKRAWANFFQGPAYVPKHPDEAEDELKELREQIPAMA